MKFDCIKINGKQMPIKIWGRHLLADNVIEQAKEIMALPFVHGVSLMPDSHFGMGGPVGAVIVTKKAVVPTLVGSDSCCGICGINTGIDYSALDGVDLTALRKSIERDVPKGEFERGKSNYAMYHNKDKTEKYSDEFRSIFDDYENFTNKVPGARGRTVMQSLGTLGGGNHFLELSVDKDNKIWVSVHSGSRGMGGAIGNYFVRVAKEMMDKLFITNIPKSLAFIPEVVDDYHYYLHGLKLTDRFAAANRLIMLRNAIRSLEYFTNQKTDNYDVIGSHHNYVAMEQHFKQGMLVTRKGAVCAREGIKNIIPVNMKFGSFVVEGKGNKDSFDSASHGAGRVMSRREARESITMDEHKAAMEGVECEMADKLLDESPHAYKDGDEVIKAQRGLVNVINRLTPFLNIKG